MTTPLQAQAQRLAELVERMKLEAQMHAQEARTANATIAEIYQLVTGATGEPGNWNGAEPVRAFIAAKEAEVGRLREALNVLVDRDFTFFSGQMIGASKPITRDEVLAARAALTQGETK